MNPPNILVIGSSNMDMVVRTPHIPLPGETIIGSDFAMISGGKGANQAVAAARLGGDVTLVARIGRDVFGDLAVRKIAEAGVKTGFIVRDSDAPSGVALICVAASGQNSIVVASGANSRLDPQDIDDALPAIRAADVVLLQFETPLATVAHAIRLAKREGKVVVVNPAPAQALPPDFLADVDVIVPNEIEAAMLLDLSLTAEPDVEAIGRALLNLGARAVVLTLGAGGAMVVTAGRSERVSALPVNAVDTTAAGDCFTGALAYALTERRDLREAAKFAAAAASISVTRRGAQTSMPSRAEVLAALNAAGS